MTVGTVDDFIAALKSALGTPYLFGGVDPFNGGADCSGLVMWAAGKCGVTVPRTTQGEWAGLPAGDGSIGDLVLFDVPSDGPPQPQHVGVCLGGGQMINDPHTRQYPGDPFGVVRIDPIPNEPSISVMGYRRIPFSTIPIPPPVTPNVLEELLDMTSDPDLAVRWAYRVCLRREVDQAGYAVHMAKLAAGGTVGQMFATLQDSQEGQAVIAAERKVLGLA